MKKQQEGRSGEVKPKVSSVLGNHTEVGVSHSVLFRSLENGSVGLDEP